MIGTGTTLSRRTRDICGIHLRRCTIGARPTTSRSSPSTEVNPDIMVLAKALTEWYLPLAITLLSEQIFSTFSALNALACTAPKASLEIFECENVEVCGDMVPA
jgi:hypothetical protein